MFIHLLAGFAVGRSDLVINGGDAGSAEGVHITQRALVMALSGESPSEPMQQVQQRQGEGQQ